MSRILAFTHGPEDWKSLLADPEKHWKTGYSARTLAHSWEAATGFPTEVAAAFGRVTDPALKGLEPLLAIPEFKVALKGGTRSSQNDIFVLARSSAGPVVIMVEGKVNESFGPTLEEWRAEASPGKNDRLEFLVKKLGLKSMPPGTTRYQLMHRTASALIVAEQYRAAAAVMLVHSFSPVSAGLEDYVEYSKLFGARAESGEIVSFGAVGGISLFGAWIPGDLAFREK